MKPTRDKLADEYPFESNFLDIDGHRLHYVDEGEGEPILCVHGNPTWSFAWRRIVKRFSDKHRVIAIDHIGCGLSDKPQDAPYTLRFHIDNLKRLIEHLDLRGATLVAHDWGGAIGCGAAGELPDRFERLVLMNTAAFRSQRIPFRIAVCRWPVVGPLGVRGLNLFARAALTMAVERKSDFSSSAKAGYLAPYDSWSNRVAIQQFVEDIPLKPNHPSYGTLVGVEQGLERLKSKPTLLVWGMKDWCFSPYFLDEFERRFPDAKVVLLDDVGHYVFEDAPEELAGAIEDFLN
ncbi:alpha/beta fold hydrolase [Stratiformator vulcanicus]|uniref:Haloalkane dehalogenase n=1 Tax=Stratiformator vulcanicus TaxID=2527980 RepID=A0A517R2B6_9PLAN|nr:alpha/beta fold hydrolase [Stratiformator vulcanicus]QDT38001.1 Haloalkane dehalogenase [Stratiformator vulcanicus]